MGLLLKPVDQEDVSSLFRKLTWWVRGAGRRRPNFTRSAVPSRGRSRRAACGRDDARRGPMGCAPRPGQRNPAARRDAHALDAGGSSSSSDRTCGSACGPWSGTACSPRWPRCRWRSGIGANTAIYSFMDAILLRSLPVSDPASLVVMKWRARPYAYGTRATNGSEFVMHSSDGYVDDATRRADGGHLSVSRLLARSAGVSSVLSTSSPTIPPGAST